MDKSMQLAEKDKNTIIILVIALLIFGIAFLGIKPAIANIKETKAQNDELSAQKKTMQTEIATLPTYKTNLESAIKDYNTVGARVFNCQTNDKIHDDVVAMVEKNGLQILSLSINDVTEAGIATYELTDESAIGGISDGGVKLAFVNISVFGTKAEIINFVNFLNETEGTYLQTVSFPETTERITVSLPIYMVVAEAF